MNNLYSQKELSLQSLNAIQEDFKNKKFEYYIGKEFYSFLLNDNIRHYKSLNFLDGRPGVLVGILITLTNNCFIEIAFEEFKYVKPFNFYYNWDLELIYKEKISKISFFYNDNCFLELE